MRIEILCKDGSPLGVTPLDIWGKGNRGVGIGGSELALLTLCEEWTKKGYEVILYNNPTNCNEIFEQRPVHAFEPKQDRDVLIVFRTPNEKALTAKGLKVWLSYDQFTLPDFPFPSFAPHVDKIVGISEFHSNHFKTEYNIHNMIVIDLPLRVGDFEFLVEKVKNRLIFTSVPDRGLMNLHAMWPTIKSNIPDASLVITSDYRLWGLNTPQNQRFFSHFMPFINSGDVQFLGALPRDKYLKELVKAEVFAYPHKEPQGNHELFCISAAEAQYAKAYPITSCYGALSTTNMGTLIPGDPESVPFRNMFVNELCELLDNRDRLVQERSKLATAIYERCHPETILNKWEDKVFT